ncbi:hypothetical protein Ahy_B06g084313 isoform D [Arachis hypogaea]|uniref:HD domain-containing protein n=1 Tax=Arachis hypogaea TaxID=3818 RepID=A0A444YRK5_ARAHY|nr:hypothetical protein Ahy_B06g084313 isoform D [Arachis hypogaea]
MAAARVHLLSASAIKPLRSSQGISFTNAFPNLIATPKPLRSRKSTSSVNSPPPMTLMFSIGILSLVYALLSTRSQFLGPELGIEHCDVMAGKLAGLLHDVGHGPFSHMFEGKFLSRVFNGDKWSHEKMSAKMINYMVDEHNIDIDPELLKKVKDYSMQLHAQELVARDSHDNVWTFRHIYRDMHNQGNQSATWLQLNGVYLSVERGSLLETLFYLYVFQSFNSLQQMTCILTIFPALLNVLGIRLANRQLANISSSVLSSDSMHIGILAAAAHAFANNSPFTVFYNPRDSPSEFVIPLAKYYKVVFLFSFLEFVR